MICCLVLGYSGVGLCIFGGKSDFCTKRGWDCAFSEGKSDFCTKRGRDCAFLEEKSDFCTKRGWDCAFQEGKKDFCKININKKDASEWGIGTETEQISCFVKFYLTELL